MWDLIRNKDSLNIVPMSFSTFRFIWVFVRAVMWDPIKNKNSLNIAPMSFSTFLFIWVFVRAVGNYVGSDQK